MDLSYVHRQSYILKMNISSSQYSASNSEGSAPPHREPLPFRQYNLDNLVTAPSLPVLSMSGIKPLMISLHACVRHCHSFYCKGSIHRCSLTKCLCRRFLPIQSQHKNCSLQVFDLHRQLHCRCKICFAFCTLSAEQSRKLDGVTCDKLCR